MIRENIQRPNERQINELNVCSSLNNRKCSSIILRTIFMIFWLVLRDKHRTNMHQISTDIMWNLIFVTLSMTTLTLANIRGSEERMDATCMEMQPPMAKVINNLAYKLTNAIDDGNNLFFSPLSISVALGMVYLGARGETAEEMKRVLQYNLIEEDNNNENVHRHFHSLLSVLGNTNAEYTLLSADGVYTQTGYEVLPEFSHDLKSYYDADQSTIDFAADGMNAIRTINNWVSNKTRGKINEMFPTPLDPTTLMVLLNAVYFKGDWKYVFDERFTQEKVFYGISGDRNVPFMALYKRLNYFDDTVTNHEFLELKYKGNHISMIFALPKTNNTDLQLSSEDMCRVRSHLRKTGVEVYIPKFSMKYEREISQDLHQLGLNNMLDPNLADFSGIRSQNDISISLIKHKAAIDVNERGSQASASTGVAYVARTAVQRQVFLANHPFSFFIFDKRTGSILFMGRVRDP